VNISHLYLYVCGSLLADQILINQLKFYCSTKVDEFLKSFYDALHPRVH